MGKLRYSRVQFARSARVEFLVDTVGRQRGDVTLKLRFAWSADVRSDTVSDSPFQSNRREVPGELVPMQDSHRALDGDRFLRGKQHRGVERLQDESLLKPRRLAPRRHLKRMAILNRAIVASDAHFTLFFSLGRSEEHTSE